MTTTLKVNEGDACVDCPLCFCDGDGDECEAAGRRTVIDAELKAPTWCPLKSGDVVVRLVRKGGVS